eukprot:scaffold18122_cov68-Phaeocystis_antarctica.AAC.5
MEGHAQRRRSTQGKERACADPSRIGKVGAAGHKRGGSLQCHIGSVEHVWLAWVIAAEQEAQVERMRATQAGFGEPVRRVLAMQPVTPFEKLLACGPEERVQRAADLVANLEGAVIGGSHIAIRRTVHRQRVRTHVVIDQRFNHPSCPRGARCSSVDSTPPRAPPESDEQRAGAKLVVRINAVLRDKHEGVVTASSHACIYEPVELRLCLPCSRKAFVLGAVGCGERSRHSTPRQPYKRPLAPLALQHWPVLRSLFGRPSHGRHAHGGAGAGVLCGNHKGDPCGGRLPPAAPGPAAQTGATREL